MKNLLLCSLLCLTIGSNYVIAQTNKSNLILIENQEVILDVCNKKVETLTYLFGKIASKGTKEEEKKYYTEACLDLFIGKGNDTKDKDGNVIFPAPKIEVTSVTRNTNIPYPIEIYLNNLRNLQYSEIIYEISNIYMPKDSSIKSIGNNMYSTVVAFCQIFTGIDGEKKVYHDTTIKTVSIYIEIDDKGRIDVLLGDIYAKNI